MADVAVIIPTYNRAPLIAAALDSVLAQTTPVRLEVAVVDDGSTDATAEALEPYLARHGREDGRVVIRYLRLGKQGVVTARNTALAQTRAPLVAFLDSDDYWAPDKLARQMALLQTGGQVGLVHTAFVYVDEQGRPNGAGVQRVENPCVGPCVEALLDEDLVIFSSVLMRRSVIDLIAREEAHGLPFDPRWTNAQDYDLLLRAALHCGFAYLPGPLTFYRLHGGHGAMGNLKRAYDYHSRVQIDFARRHGQRLGITPDDARGRARRFLFGRAESLFWQRQLGPARDLCELARELGLFDARFASLEARTLRPAWLYHAKDRLDRLLRRGGGKPRDVHGHA